LLKNYNKYKFFLLLKNYNSRISQELSDDYNN